MVFRPISYLLFAILLLLAAGCTKKAESTVHGIQDSVAWAKKVKSIRDTVLLDFIRVLRTGRLDSLKAHSAGTAYAALVDTADMPSAQYGDLAFQAEALAEGPHTFDYADSSFLMVSVNARNPASWHFRKMDGQWKFVGKYSLTGEE